jgi:WD40 repeat protein
MRRWFLSYNSQDLALVQGLEAALRRKDADAHIFFAPKSLRAGGHWLPEVAKEIAEATAFILLVGEKGLGPWQAIEYYEALDRRVKAPDFPVVLVLLDGQPAPGLPFLRQLHWIVTPDPASEQSLARLMDAAAGMGTRPGELWRHTAPYRGLAAMTESDSDFFFGRTRETVKVIRALEATPDKLPVLLGNSGVGKSSLAQAGVLASLARQDWPEHSANAGPWPQAFRDSRRWCFLTVRPGGEPLKAVVEPFLRTWQLDATDPLWAQRQAEWIAALLDGKLTLRDLLDATERRYQELGQPKPPAFFLYVDQGEELYVRAEERQRRRFSDILAHGLGDPRLRALMSIRSDFLGALQNDELLFNAHRKIDVPPLREAELREVVSRPATLLSARFETDGLAVDIARRTAEESAKDAGALPLLSYLLDDMWTQMVRRGDGVLRLPAQAMELGGVLAERANAYLARNPTAEEALRRVLTLKLATVREDGEPTRRRGLRSEFTDAEWRLVSELADHPNRLLVTATPEGGETYAEVAHEAIFRRWEKLRDWVASEREFLIWKGGLEAVRRQWESAAKATKNDALLMGFALAQAQSWLVHRAKDVSKADREFIHQSLNRQVVEREQREKLRKRLLVSAIAALALVIGLAGVATYQWDLADRQKVEAQKRQKEAQHERNLALITQSRFLVQQANRQADAGDVVTGTLLALAALPDSREGIERPYLPGAEFALFALDQRRREVAVLKGQDRYGGVAAFSPDGMRILTAPKDDTARIWDAGTLQQVAILSGHNQSVLSISFSPDARRIVTGSQDNTARIWDAETYQQIAVLKGHTHYVKSAVFSPDGNHVLTASADGTARIWDAHTFEQIAVLKGSDYNRSTSNASFSPDGRRVVTASEDKTTRVWDARTHQQIAVIRGHTDVVMSAVFSPDGKRLLTASWDKTARIWDAETYQQIAVLKGHNDWLERAAFSPDGRRIVTVSRDNMARIWDAELNEEVAVLRGHSDMVHSAAFSPDGRRLVTASKDGTARIWLVEPYDSIAVIEVKNYYVASATFSRDGRRVVTACSDNTVRIWDAETFAQIAVLEGHDNVPLSAAFSPDGRRLVTTARDQTARVWNAETYEQITVLRGHGDWVNSAAFSPDGKRVVTASGDRTARIWDPITSQQIAVLRPDDNNKVLDATFSADGRRVVTVGSSRALVWDANTFQQIAELKGHQDRVHSVAFSADGRRLVTASEDKTARIWDAETSASIAALKGHNRPVTSAVFSPDGQRVLTTSLDNTARIWDAETQEQIVVLKVQDGVSSAEFSPDGRRVVIASGERTARIWRVYPATQDLVDHVKAVVPRCLTRAQREEAFLDSAPLAWCIEMEKWPYHTQIWKDWLKYKRANANPPLADTPEWLTWLASRSHYPAPAK